MICCGVDCGPCSGSPCGDKNADRCPAKCNPQISIEKGLCNGCKTYRPNRLSKKQARKEKVEDRKRSRYN
jgi:hypothetical protein